MNIKYLKAAIRYCEKIKTNNNIIEYGSIGQCNSYLRLWSGIQVPYSLNKTRELYHIEKKQITQELINKRIILVIKINKNFKIPILVNPKQSRYDIQLRLLSPI